MRLHRSRAATATAVVCAAALMFGGTSAVLAQENTNNGVSPNSDGPVGNAGVDRQSALVVLREEPLATAVTERTANGRIALGSAQARDQRRIIADERAAFQRWLRANASGAKIVGSHDLAVNAVTVKLNGATLETLRRAPQVRAAQFEAVYEPLGHDDPQLDLIDAIEGWEAAGGGADAGRLDDNSRVKVGIIDTGVDTSHPCFDDAGYPAGDTQPGSELTNNKVIVAKVFHNKAGQLGLTPEDMNGHGTHVAGTVACNLHTDAAVGEVDVAYDPSGVAPAAQLGNYAVFPGPDSSARSEDILNAMEAAYVDGMHLVNMSLGGGASGVQDLLTIAVDNLDQAGMISVVAQGNDGPGRYTVGSPGSAERALTVGASSVGHFVGSPVTVDGKTYGAAAGDFATVDGDLTAPLGVVLDGEKLSEACSALTADILNDKIALISRGSCSFSQKIRNAQNAGAVAVLVANNTAGDPSAMASDGTADQPTVPAYMVALSTGKALLDSDGASTTIGAELEYLETGNDDIMAAFSSQGPTDVDWRVKPDVVAPGVNVLSSVPGDCGDTGCWAFFQGTSMATPHTAGAAAVVIDAFLTAGRDYTAEQVRSAIVNTAEQGGLTSRLDGTTPVTDYNIVGAGQLDLDSAVAAQVAVGPVSTSFGKVPGGSGQSITKSVRLSSLTGEAMTVTLSLTDPDDGVGFALGESTVQVPADGWVSVPVTATVSRGTATRDYQGQIEISVDGAEVAHSPLYVRVG